jgi:hypothetical protein
VDIKFVPDVLDMGVDRSFGDKELLGNLPIRPTSGNQPSDLLFPAGQPGCSGPAWRATESRLAADRPSRAQSQIGSLFRSHRSPLGPRRGGSILAEILCSLLEPALKPEFARRSLPSPNGIVNSGCRARQQERLLRLRSGGCELGKPIERQCHTELVTVPAPDRQAFLIASSSGCGICLLQSSIPKVPQQVGDRHLEAKFAFHCQALLEPGLRGEGVALGEKDDAEIRLRVGDPPRVCEVAPYAQGLLVVAASRCVLTQFDSKVS